MALSSCCLLQLACRSANCGLLCAVSPCCDILLCQKGRMYWQSNAICCDLLRNCVTKPRLTLLKPFIAFRRYVMYRYCCQWEVCIVLPYLWQMLGVQWAGETVLLLEFRAGSKSQCLLTQHFGLDSYKKGIVISYIPSLCEVLEHSFSARDMVSFPCRNNCIGAGTSKG